MFCRQRLLQTVANRWPLLLHYYALAAYNYTLAFYDCV